MSLTLRLPLPLLTLFCLPALLPAQLLPVQEQGRWGLCDTTGTRLASGADSATTSQTLLALWQNGTATLWRANSKKPLTSRISRFWEADSVVAVCQGGQWSLINKSSWIIQSQQYDSISVQKELLIGHKQGTPWVLSQAGVRLMAAIPGKRAIRYRNGWIQWMEPDGDHLGLCSPGGAIIPARYTGFCFAPPLIWADSGGKWFLYNEYGRLLQPKPFGSPMKLDRGFAINSSGNTMGVHNAQGEWVIAPEYEAIERYGNHLRCRLKGVWQQKSLIPGDTRPALLIGAPDLQPAPLNANDFGNASGNDPGNRRDSMLLPNPEVVFNDSLPWKAATGASWSRYCNALFIRGTQLCLMQVYTVNKDSTKQKVRYGLYQYYDGKLILPVVLTDVYYEDFIAGKIARCLTEMGRMVWVTAQGRLIYPAGRLMGAPSAAGTPACVEGRITAAHKHGMCEDKYDRNLHKIIYFDTRPWKSRYTAAVITGKLWGLLDSTGQWLIKPVYEAVSAPSGGYVSVRLGGKVGVICLATQQVSWLNHTDIAAVPGAAGIFLVSDSIFRFEVAISGQEAVAVITGNAIGKPDNGLIPTRERGKWGLKRPDNTWLVPPVYDALGRFSGNLAPVRKGIRWGYLTRSGVEQVPLTFLRAGDFVQGHALVRTSTRYGIIDTTGAWVVEPIFINVKAVRDSFFIAGGDSRYGLYTLTGRTVISPTYRDIAFCGSLVRLFTGKLYGFANLEGTVLCSPRFDRTSDMVGGGIWCITGYTEYRVLANGSVQPWEEKAPDPASRKIADQPFSQPVNTSFSTGKLLQDVYHAARNETLATNILGAAAHGRYLTVSGPDWRGYLRADGSWLFQPAGAATGDNTANNESTAQTK